MFVNRIYPGMSLKTSFVSPGKPLSLVFASPRKSWKTVFYCLYKPCTLWYCVNTTKPIIKQSAPYIK